jgi:hypothetical protein
MKLRFVKNVVIDGMEYMEDRAYPTASLGLTAGQDMSIVIATKTSWAGNVVPRFE